MTTTDAINSAPNPTVHTKDVLSDYAINWKLSVPQSLNDEFITVDDLRKSTQLVGTLKVISYIQPSNDLYLRTSGQPGGIFTYNVEMNRIGDPIQEVRATTYPFVWRDDGPVELNLYFGY